MPRTGGAGGGTKIPNLHGLSFQLYLYAKIHPEIWDIIPQVPKYSKGTLNVIAGQIIKTIAFGIDDVTIKDTLNKLGFELYTTGKQVMKYDDDWFCGTWPHPVPPHFGFFGPFTDPSEVELNPQPLPPRNYFGAVLSIVADAIDNQNIASSLKRISDSLIKQ